MSAERDEHAAAPPEAQGWTRRFTAIGGRLIEAVVLYRGLGYEIWLAPADTDQVELGNRDDSCTQCFVMTFARTIYTRNVGGTAGASKTERG